MEGYGAAASALVVERSVGFLGSAVTPRSYCGFIILVIINFMVITKGAGRIAESARAAKLDGMPAGKWRLTPILMPV